MISCGKRAIRHEKLSVSLAEQDPQRLLADDILMLAGVTPIWALKCFTAVARMFEAALLYQATNSCSASFLNCACRINFSPVKASGAAALSLCGGSRHNGKDLPR